MVSALEIRNQLGRLLSNQMSLDQFESWFAPLAWNIHKHGDPEAQRLAHEIDHLMAIYDDDGDAFRSDLAAIAAPLSENEFGPATSIAQSNGTSDTVEVRLAA